MTSKENVERLKAFKLLNLLLEHNLLEKHGDEIVQVFEDTGNEIIADNLRPILPHWWREKKEIVKLIHRRKDIHGQLLLATLLDDLENTLDIETSQTIALTGKAGTGKTETAIAFANENEKRYKHIIWINCGEGKIRHELENLAKDLKIENLTVNINRLAEKCFHKLSHSTIGKCLLVFDNVDESSNIQQVLPKERNFHTIVTYRKSIWGTKNEFRSHELKEFEEDETLEFLQPILKENRIECSGHQLRRIHKLLDGRPSALQRLIAVLHARKISIAECTKKKQLMNVGVLNPRERKATVSYHKGTSSNISGQHTNEEIMVPTSEKLPEMWRIPPRNLQFIGRDDLIQKIWKHFCRGDQPLVLAACSGLGGVGKTQIALEFSWQNFEDYQGVIWFNAESKDRLIEDYVQLGHALNLPLDKDKMGTEEQARYVIHWLENPAREGWLIIYDNAPIYGGEKGINGLLPVKGGKILITSRYSVGWPQSFSVEVFSREESKMFIEEVLHAELSEEEKDSLAETLGDLPLALAQACAYINKLKLKISRYLQLYNKKKEQLLKDKTLSESEGTIPYDSSKPIVFITWDITMEAISEESLLAANWLICCAYLSPNDIPDFLLETFSENSENNPNCEIYEEALGILNSYSMLTCNEENHSSSIHRLVQEVIQLKEEKKCEEFTMTEKWRSVNSIGNILLMVFPSGDNTHEGREKIIKLIPHLEVCLLYLQKRQQAELNVSPHLANQIELNTICQFLFFIAEGCFRLGDYIKQRDKLVQALEISEKYYGPDHEDVAITLTDLGNTYESLGDPKKAREILERALVIMEKYYCSDHFKVAIPLASLGNAYGSLGHMDKKLEMLERAVRIKEKYYGVDNIEVATTLTNLGNVHGSLGNAKTQREMLERALTIKKNWYGPDHVEVAVTLASLGNAYVSLGDAEKARDILNHTLALCEKYYGPDHLKVAVILGNLANVYGSLGDAEKKREMLERSLTIKEKWHGPDHIRVAVTLGSLGNAYSSLGDSKKAHDMLNRALTISETYYGPDHVEVAVILVSLGNTYGSLGNAEMKREILERALKINEKYYGPDHVEVAVTLENLGNAYGSLGDFEKKRDLLKRTLKIGEKYYGPDHIEVALTLTNLGTAYESLGDAEKARDLLERALAINVKHNGPDHVNVAVTLGSLGNAYGSLGDSEKKRDMLERALTINEKYYGLEHVEVAKTLFNLGNAYGSLGDLKMKRDMLERALTIEEKYYGQDHVEIAVTLSNLGNAYLSLGDAQKALDKLERALVIKEKNYGPDHIKVARTLALLGDTYRSLGDMEKALGMLERTLKINEKCYGSDHIVVARTLVNLGSAHGSLGNADKKRKMLERVLAIYEKHYDPDHIEVAVILESLGNVYGSLRLAEKKRDMLERALTINEKYYGPDHVVIARTLLNLGTAYGSLGDTEKQREMMTRVFAIRKPK